MTHAGAIHKPIGLLFAACVIFASVTGPSLAKESRGAGDGIGQRSNVQSNATSPRSAAANGLETRGIPGGGLFTGALLSAYHDAIQRLRGGPGEGSTPHVSPTVDWKGEVRTNICNFQHECK
jgi:hypothetical protein